LKDFVLKIYNLQPAGIWNPPMIPREILKKIRQIELRTNRIVTRLRERARPRRWHGRTEAARIVPAGSVRRVRRKGAPNHSRGGCAPHFSTTTNLFSPARL